MQSVLYLGQNARILFSLERGGDKFFRGYGEAIERDGESGGVEMSISPLLECYHFRMTTRTIPLPIKIFIQAESYLLAIDQLQRTSGPDRFERIIVPISSLCAFACELYFKSLICGEKGEVPHGHDLLTLFLRLNGKTQNAIEKRWNERLADWESDIVRMEMNTNTKTPRSIREILRLSRNSYNQMRYLYEESPDFLSVGSDLPMVIRSVIYDQKPDWLASALALLGRA